MPKQTHLIVVAATLACFNAPSIVSAEPNSKHEAIHTCMAGYSREGKCDWNHWSEMYEACALHKFSPLDDQATIAAVKAGRCDWNNWSRFAEWLDMRLPGDKAQAIDSCMAVYSRSGMCDWNHWSEMYEVCELYKYSPLDDEETIAAVKAGKCDWNNWSNFAGWLHNR